MTVRCLVGIIANDAARFSEFWSCVLRLQVPKGSLKEQVIGGDWCAARNDLARRCIDEGFDYLWFMDDDHSFAPDLLAKLLSAATANDLPIVNPLCTTRTAPFHLVTYAANPDQEASERYLPISLDGVPGEGIVELEAGGCAGMLIRRDVLEATRVSERWDGEPIEDQWFEYGDRSEDIIFCEKAKAAGFKLYADLSCRLGHITTAVVMPGIEDGKWITGLTVGRDMQLAIPTAEDLLRQQEQNEYVEETEILDNTLPAEASAERVEVWVDEYNRWHWRSINDVGKIIAKGSAVNEESVLAAAEASHPGATVYLIAREVDDSRNIRPYRVPDRMWDR